MRNAHYLNEEQTVLSVETDDGVTRIVEKGVSEDFEALASGGAGVISPYVPDNDDGPEPYDPEVSRMQAKIALLQMGLLDDVEALIAIMDRATQLAWAEATMFKRSSPLLNGLADAITWPDGSPLTASDIDELFEIALQIEV